MKLPVIEGIIRRRILVNYRVDPNVIRRVLPLPFRPKLHKGYAVAGICMIRLEHIRPRRFPQFVGVHSENAAHRIAVLWDDAEGKTREGVFITRRDTDSQLNHWLGGRVFPGEHHKAEFDVDERNGDIAISMRSCDTEVEIEVLGQRGDVMPAGSIFHSVEESSRFFESGRLGYSVTRDPHRLDGIVLETRKWRVQPLHVARARSSYFDNESMFPSGTATLDHALFMSNVAHEWHSAGSFCI